MNRVVCALALMLALSVGVQAAQVQAKKRGAAPSSGAVTKTLETKIRQLWQDFKDRNKEALAAVLADNDTQVWFDGKVRDKTTTVKDVDSVTLNSYALSNITITPLSPAAALATYRVKANGTFNGQPFDTTLEVTEVFEKRGGDWQEVRYHESESKESAR
jgi:hypothetical protein